MLHSSIVQHSSIDPSTAGDSSNDARKGFLVPGCICAFSASESSTDTLCFVKIFERHDADQLYADDYGVTVA